MRFINGKIGFYNTKHYSSSIINKMETHNNKKKLLFFIGSWMAHIYWLASWNFLFKSLARLGIGLL